MTNSAEVRGQANADSEPLDAIAQRLGISKKSARNIARPYEDRTKALKMYRSGIGMRTIAAALGTTSCTILRWLRKEGGVRSKGEAGLIKSSGHPLSWGSLTPARAWVLGIIYGNGGIAADGDDVTITMDNRDRDVLEKIQAVLNYSGRRIYRLPGCLRLNVSSRRFVAALKFEYGLDHHKGIAMRWPELNAEMLPHFVRGLVDSDGSWHALSGRRSHLIRFSYCSISHEFVHGMHAAITEAIPVHEVKVAYKKARLRHIHGRPLQGVPSSVLTYSHLDCKTLGNWIYSADSDTIRGDRKFAYWREHTAGVVIGPGYVLRHERKIPQLHQGVLRAS